MASEKKVRKVRYPLMHKCLSGVSLIAFTVTFMAGLSSGARFTTITMRALVVMLVVALISRVVMQIIASYEEIHGRKA